MNFLVPVVFSLVIAVDIAWIYLLLTGNKH